MTNAKPLLQLSLEELHGRAVAAVVARIKTHARTRDVFGERVYIEGEVPGHSPTPYAVVGKRKLRPAPPSNPPTLSQADFDVTTVAGEADFDKAVRVVQYAIVGHNGGVLKGACVLADTGEVTNDGETASRTDRFCGFLLGPRE